MLIHPPELIINAQRCACCVSNEWHHHYCKSAVHQPLVFYGSKKLCYYRGENVPFSFYDMSSAGLTAKHWQEKRHLFSIQTPLSLVLNPARCISCELLLTSVLQMKRLESVKDKVNYNLHFTYQNCNFVDKRCTLPMIVIKGYNCNCEY